MLKPQMLSFFWSASFSSLRSYWSAHLVLTSLVRSAHSEEEDVDESYISWHRPRNIILFLIILITVLTTLRGNIIYPHFIDKKPRLRG